MHIDLPIDFSEDLTDADKLARVRALSDGDLRYFHDQLSHPGLLRSGWLELIEAELKRRGHIRPA